MPLLTRLPMRCRQAKKIIMKKRKVKIIVYSILTLFVSGFLSIVIIGVTLLPIVRKYTVTNNISKSFYITPLMQFGVGGWDLEEEWENADKMKKYIEKVDDFSILSQYLFYSPPALPTFARKDIKVNPNSKVVLYIDYENIKQEGGPQILLLKDEQDNYFYKEANFWESDEITDNSLLQALDNLIKSKENGSGSVRQWFIITFLFTLILLFPYLLIRNIKLLRKEKKASLQSSRWPVS